MPKWLSGIGKLFKISLQTAPFAVRFYSGIVFVALFSVRGNLGRSVFL